YPRTSLATGATTMTTQVRRIEEPYWAKRRGFLKTTAGAAGALAVPGFYGKAALAQQKDYPKLGNYPEGVSGDTVTAGLTLDLTGPYSAEGNGQKRGFEQIGRASWREA